MPTTRKRPSRRPVLGIFSRRKSLYSTRRLMEAAKARGLRPKVIDALKCHLVLEQAKPRLLFDGEDLPRLLVALPRIGAKVTSHGLAVVRQLEAMGVPLVNGAQAIAQSRDKLRCLQLLAAHGVPIPRTVLARGSGNVDVLLAQVGGLPAILKLIQGTQGVGVMIAHSRAEVESFLSTLWDLGQEILLQEFIAESKGRDVRVLVVGDRVVAAMRREARAGEFRSNIHRGASGVAIELDPAYAEAAVQAVRVLGLDVAGVDLFESTSGPKVMEVNSSPGFEGLEKATGLDIAAAIVDHALAVASRAEKAKAKGEEGSREVGKENKTKE